MSRGEPAGCTGALWAVAPAPGGGDRSGVRRGRPVLPGGGQGAGEVRDAARACVDGVSVTEAAASHGYSRGGFYLVLASFSEQGMAGLVDERRGRRGPLRLTDEIVAVPASGAVRELGRGARARGRAAVRCEPAPPDGGARAQMSRELLAGGRGGAGRLRAAARPGAGRGARARRRRAAVRALRAVGADRLTAGRPGVCGRASWALSARRGRRTRIRASLRSPTGFRSSWRPRPRPYERSRQDEGRDLRTRVNRGPGEARHDRLAGRAVARPDGRRRSRDRGRVPRRRLLRLAA